jgi:hypothetical protein
VEYVRAFESAGQGGDRRENVRWLPVMLLLLLLLLLLFIECLLLVQVPTAGIYEEDNAEG